jgi:pseudaminic acid synthase
MTHSFAINGRKIGPDQPPYVIAEVSGNHNGDLQRAFRLIQIIKEAGADAVKFQTYTADSLTIDSHRPEFTLKGGAWDGRNLYQLYQAACTPWDWFPALFARAREIGITIFSSPFDKAAVVMLESLDIPAYKIASNEIHDWALLELVASTGKPMILSTGTATRQDVADTIDFVTELNVRDLAVLHCISAYPAPPEDVHLRTLDDIVQSFDVVPGFSDHTLGITAAAVAVARGACIIEKHVTLDRNDGGPDSSFSLEPEELKALCAETFWAWKSLGKVQYSDNSSLKSRNVFTRQFWTVADIKPGDILSAENIRSIRAPSDAGGISARYYREILGQTALLEINRYEPLSWNALKNREIDT